MINLGISNLLRILSNNAEHANGRTATSTKTAASAAKKSKSIEIEQGPAEDQAPEKEKEKETGQTGGGQKQSTRHGDCDRDPEML